MPQNKPRVRSAKTPTKRTFGAKPHTGAHTKMKLPLLQSERSVSNVSSEKGKVHLRAGEDFELPLPSGKTVHLTRRQIMKGAAGGVAGVLLASGGYALSRMSEGTDTGFSTLSVAVDDVVSSNDFGSIEDPGRIIDETLSVELPYGTLVWANDASVAACLIPTDEVDPLNEVGLLSLTSGYCATVLERAVGADDGFAVYDVRANENGLVWVESNILDGLWRVYAADHDIDSIGEPRLLDEGDSSWEMPTLMAVGDQAWWQSMPQADGEAADEPSTLKRAPFSSGDVEEVYTCSRRMATAPYACVDGAVITPRLDTAGTYYQLTYLDGETGAVQDAMVLPSGMKPLEAGYGAHGFAFSFDAIYSYGDGIANLGTYTPFTPPDTDAVAAQIVMDDEEGTDASVTESLSPFAVGTPLNTDAYSAVPWFRFARTPSAAPAWCGDWFVVKTPAAVCCVDMAERRYFTLETKSGSDSYGDYLATTGSPERFVTFTNIDHTDINGTHEKHCLVRVWTLNA